MTIPTSCDPLRAAGYLLASLFLGCLGPKIASAESPRLPADVQSLDGTWQIAPDLYDRGREDHWSEPSHFPSSSARSIEVPGTITETWPNTAPLEQAANLDWYMATFRTEAIPPGRRRYLRFGAVRYASEVWLNGTQLGIHVGGDDPFEFDVTSLLNPGRPNTVIVRVASPYLGGINQHVDLVSQPDVRIIDCFARPDAQKMEIRLEVNVENNTGAPATVEVSADWGETQAVVGIGSKVLQATAPAGQSVVTLVLPVPEVHRWTPEQPNLYSVRVSSLWRGAPSREASMDHYSLRTGFRDLRIVDGFFYLNGKRIFLRSTHGNYYEPISIQGTPRTMKYLKEDFIQLKRAGFNMLRIIVSAALPEQLDAADEAGLMVYSEHETSWLLKDPAQYGVSLKEVVRRDRNHPSLAIWGLLNETASMDIYRQARDVLPALRAIDDTRLTLLSSGRFDGDFRTGSASNPGSSTWDVYMGGEDPNHPISTGTLVDEIGAYRPGTGDAHVYQHYPTSWAFIEAFERLGQGTKPFFLSEAGDGSSYNPYEEKREIEAAGDPPNIYAWGWIMPSIEGLQKTWKTYGLDGVYPSIESMLVDSAWAESRQRALMFSIVRSNPRVNGYSLTSLQDSWGSGEGIMTSFREFKAGHLAVLQEGWAPLRWCLLANPMNGYADQPLHLRVSLSSDDQLAPGEYPAVLKIYGSLGTVWKTEAKVNIPAGADAPMAFLVFDQDVSIPGLKAGTYCLEADLIGHHAAADRLQFVVASPLTPGSLGAVSVVGLDTKARDFLTRNGAQIHDYAEGEAIDREVIVVGEAFKGGAAAWRGLYAHSARGAHVIFLEPKVFVVDPKKRAIPKWLALGMKGKLISETEWLYHKDIVAKKEPAFGGLQTGLMTPEYYAGVLAPSLFFQGGTVPGRTEAVAIRCGADGAAAFDYRDGVIVGTYRYHDGHFTINGLNILGNLGNPAADHLLLNMLTEARSDAAPAAPLPPEFVAEMDSLGIVDTP